MSEGEDYRKIHEEFTDPEDATDKSELLRFESFEKKRIGSEAQLDKRGIEFAERGKKVEHLDPYEVRKKKALSQGTRVEYITCPMCGKNRPVKLLTRTGKTAYFSPYLDRIYQVRKGGGRGIGFFIVHDETLDLELLYQSTDKRDIYHNIKETAKAILERCKRIEGEKI